METSRPPPPPAVKPKPPRPREKPKGSQPEYTRGNASYYPKTRVKSDPFSKLTVGVDGTYFDVATPCVDFNEGSPYNKINVTQHYENSYQPDIPEKQQYLDRTQLTNARQSSVTYSSTHPIRYEPPKKNMNEFNPQSFVAAFIAESNRRVNQPQHPTTGYKTKLQYSQTVRDPRDRETQAKPMRRVPIQIETERTSDDSNNHYDFVAFEKELSTMEQPVNPTKPTARVQRVHSMMNPPMTWVPPQSHKIQRINVHTEGREAGKHSGGLMEECRDFLNRVEWLYSYVKETREMYEKDDVLMAVLFEGEMKMFSHMDEIENALYSFIWYLKEVIHDVVKVIKLLKEWLEKNYFECFESCYLNRDIEQNLVSFVKETRPAFHQILQGKNSQSQHRHLERNYSFNDLEDRFKEPKKWYHYLTYHLTKLKEAQTLYYSDSGTSSLIEYETRKLLKEKQANLVEKYEEKKKHHEHHSSSIVGRLQFEKNEHGLIAREASLVVAEDYVTIQGNVKNIQKISPIGKSAYTGNKAYLFVFERVVLLTTLEEKKGKRTYRVLECCNKNYVDIEKVPKNVSPQHPHTFVLYFYKPIEGSNAHSSTQYILALIGNEVTNAPIMSDWLKAITVPEGGSGSISYATWSRPSHTICQQYVNEKEDITFNIGDEVEVIEETDDREYGWCYVERSHDSSKDWIPIFILGNQLANEYKKTVDLKKAKRHERELERESMDIKKQGRRK